MQLNCKVIKKWQTPHFYTNPPISGLYPLSSNIFGTSPPKWLNFWKALAPLPLRGGGGSNYVDMLQVVNKKCVVSTVDCWQISLLFQVSNGNLNGNLKEDNPNEDIFKKQPPVLFCKKGVIKYFPKFIGNPVDKETSTRCLTKTNNTSCQDILQISKRCLKGKSERHLRKTSSTYLCKIYCRCLIKDVLKMSY